MSLNVYRTTIDGKAVTVTAGWDRPLGGYFMSVCEDDSGEWLYTNLAEIESHPANFAPFERVLKELGIELPEAMLDAIESDGIENAGNIVREWPRPEAP